MESFSITDFSGDPRYAPSVARVRELERRLLPKRTFVRMLESPSDTAVIDELRGTDYAEALPDARLSDGLTAAFDRIDDIRRKQSAELGIPASIREIQDACYGINEAKRVFRQTASAGRGEHFGGEIELPASLSEALKTAAVDFDHRQSMFRFDMLLDRAYSEYVRAKAQEIDIPFVRHFLWHVLDARAIHTAVRWRTWPAADTTTGERGRRIEKALLPTPGFLDADTIAAAADESAERLPGLFRFTPYGAAVRAGAEHFQVDGSWAYLEKLTADLISDFCRQARYTPFGIEPLIAYEWFARQEAANVRLVVGARRARVPVDQVVNRLREGYDA